MKLYTFYCKCDRGWGYVEAVGKTICQAYQYLYKEYNYGSSDLILLNCYELTESEYEFIENPTYAKKD
jgi:hypothetical protein